MHDLLRLFAIERSEREDPAEERSAAIDRALQHYCDTLDSVLAGLRPLDVVHSTRPRGTRAPYGGIAECLDWLAAETPNLLVVAAQGALTTASALPAVEIARMLQEHLWKQDQHAEIEQTGRIAMVAAAHGLEPRVERLALFVQAVADQVAGRYAVAHERFHLALALCADDQLDRARILVSLGGLLTNYMGPADEAVALLEEALSILDEHGTPGATVGALNVLARAHHLAGRGEIALALADQALDLARENEAPHSIAICVADLGVLHGHLGDYDRALVHLDECMARAREVGNREDEWTTLLSRSEIHLRRGEPEEALVDARRSLTMTSQLGSAYGRAAGHRQVARALLAVGHPGDSGWHRRTAVFLFEGVDVRLPAFFESFLGYPDPVEASAR
jgi:tetratricopeptide (TPR) repeat protein